jgi:hypothetical protein
VYLIQTCKKISFILTCKHNNNKKKGYCEGVVGNFNAESVHFVELDPRVLESLDADLDFATDNSQYRNSASSYGTDLLENNPHHSISSRLQYNSAYRDSLHSFSSSSDHNLQQHQHQQQHQMPPQTSWISKPSFESINTNNSSSISISHNNYSHISNQSYNNYSTEGKKRPFILLYMFDN